MKVTSAIRRHEISDNSWERIKHHFQERTPHTMGRPCKNNRKMLNGILWILGTGAPWRDLPERYGPWQTVYKRFARWQKEGIFEAIFEELTKDADLQDISMDGTYIKAHKASAGAKRGELPTRNVQNAEALVQNQCIGVSRGGRSTKIHVAVDALGNPIRVFLTSGEVHDSKVARILLDLIEIAGSTVLADKAYGAYELREYIAMRFEKLAVRYLAFVHMACALVWLK